VVRAIRRYSHLFISLSRLPKLTTLNTGIMKLDGVDLHNYNVKWLRSVVGLVGKSCHSKLLYHIILIDALLAQEPVLFSGTIADNISQVVENATLDDIEAAARSANAHEFITQFPDGYHTQVGEKGV
jgi:ABC-type multidrug transport system fused ATPase/permease subunit